MHHGHGTPSIDPRLVERARRRPRRSRGTGSHGVVVEDVFVPAERSSSLLSGRHALPAYRSAFSYSHARMLGRSVGFIADELERTDRLIRAAGHGGPIYFRPPYGKKLLALPWYLRRTGRTSILWDVEPESDPAVAASPAQMVAHVLARVQPGSIILLHVMYPGRETSRRALPGILAGLQARGYELVTVSELLQAAGSR